MITPFRDGQVDFDALQAQVEFQIAGRHDLRLPGGHDRRIAHALARGARAGDLGRGRGGRRADQGHARHRLQQHGRGPAADALGRQGRGRRGAGRRLPTTTSRRRKASISTSRPWPRRSRFRSASTTSPAARARTSSRKRSSAWPSCRTSRWSRRRPARWIRPRRSSRSTDLTVLSGDDSLTLPLMAIGGRGRDLGGRQHRAGRHDRADPGVRSGRYAPRRCKWHRKLFPLCRDMLGLATNPIPIKAAMKLLGPRHGRTADADDAAGGRAGGEAAGDAGAVRDESWIMERGN